MTQSHTDKSDDSLNMSDLVGPETSPQPAPDHTIDSSESPQEADKPNPSVGSVVSPKSNNPPVFRNPLAAGLTAQLGDFGNKPQANSPASATTMTFVRPNLSPKYDTFLIHGANDDTASATTLLGKIGLTLRLPKIFSPRHLKYIGIGVASALIFLLIFNFGTISTQLSYWLNPPKPQAPIASPLTQASVAAIANQAETVPAGEIISIPKLNVANVPIVFEQSISETAIQKSLQNGVVHYAGTAAPGDRSNIVIVGHSSNDWWEPGNYKFVFALLEKMAVGDQIQVNYKQKKYVYQVTGSKVVEPTEISVLQPTSEPQLTLITCTPPGTSWKRLVVTAKQIEPLPNVVSGVAKASPNSQSAQQAALPGNAPSFFDQLKQWLGLAKAPVKTESNSALPAS